MDTESVARDATVVLDGLTFHYREWGHPAAPPVVLLHAYTQHARTWDSIARGLSNRFRVLALDQRGHGESAHAADYHELRLVGDLAGFVDALQLERFSAVGFSLGAMRQPATRRSTPTALNVWCCWSASPPVRRRETSRGSRRCVTTSPGCARSRRW
jgi:esterase